MTDDKMSKLQFIEPKRVLIKNDHLIILLSDDGKAIRKHINFFKAILGVEFTPKGALDDCSKSA